MHINVKYNKPNSTTIKWIICLYVVITVLCSDCFCLNCRVLEFPRLVLSPTDLLVIEVVVAYPSDC